MSNWQQIKYAAAAMAAYDGWVFDNLIDGEPGTNNLRAHKAYWMELAETAIKAAFEELWQPIETAPKDGTVILAHPGAELDDDNVWTWPKGYVLDVIPARWHEPNNRSQDEAGWYAPTTYVSPGVYDDPGDTTYSIQLEPTHWMPLPEPPTK